MYKIGKQVSFKNKVYDKNVLGKRLKPEVFNLINKTDNLNTSNAITNIPLDKVVRNGQLIPYTDLTPQLAFQWSTDGLNINSYKSSQEIIGVTCPADTVAYNNICTVIDSDVFFKIYDTDITATFSKKVPKTQIYNLINKTDNLNISKNITNIPNDKVVRNGQLVSYSDLTAQTIFQWSTDGLSIDSDITTKVNIGENIGNVCPRGAVSDNGLCKPIDSETYFDSINYSINYDNIQTISESSNFSCHFEELREIPLLKNANTFVYEDSNILKFKTLLEYNFLDEKYEDYLSKKELRELQIPNFYNFIENIIKSYENTNNFNSLGTSFLSDPSTLEQIIFNNKVDPPEPVLSSKITYFDSEYVDYKQGVKQKVKLEKYLNKYNPFKEQFPFYADIYLDTHNKLNNNISDVFFKNGLTFDFFRILDSKDFKQIENNKYFILDNDFFAELLNNNNLNFLFDLNNSLKNKKQKYNEVIGYRLQKFAGSGGNFSSPIQEWVIPNCVEGSINLVDTQIHYDKEYTYKLNYYLLSIDKMDDSIEPSIIIYMLEDQNISPKYTNKLRDYPPLEPEVQFVPYIGVDKKIKILCNTSTGLKKSTPINILASDSQISDSNIFAQNQDIYDPPVITYQTDEPAKLFEIFRTEKKPKSYNDFVNGKFFSIDTDNSSGGGIDDDIQPNIKYYYIIRCVDTHGNISNPSEVYELEMINDRGTIYPLINIVSLNENENNVQPIKSFKQLIKIKPSTQNLITSLSDDNKLIAGFANEAVWNKNFKIRLTSKSSGKKIDFNIKFKNYSENISVSNATINVSNAIEQQQTEDTSNKRLCKDNNGNTWENIGGKWYVTSPEGKTTVFGGRVILPNLTCT